MMFYDGNAYTGPVDGVIWCEICDDFYAVHGDEVCPYCELEASK